MKFHVLTLFPEMIENAMATSITGRAMEAGIIELNCVNMRDHAEEKRKGRVDDYPYGGGAGMVIQPEPVFASYEEVCSLTGYRPRCVYMTPQGETFTQKKAKELALEDDVVLLCGHYEGIDERVITRIVTDEISIGDYVLTGGELAALVVMDAVSRMVPGVLTNSQSGDDESFGDGLLEYPQYTRPEVWQGIPVPGILLSGHHANVDEWRRQQSLLRTAARRPDLLKEADLSDKDRKFLRNTLAKPEET